MLSEHISGDNFITPASRSSTDLVGVRSHCSLPGGLTDALSGSGCAGIRGKAQAPLQRQELPAEALGEKAPDALRRQQHHGDGDGAEHEKIEAAEIGKRLPQNEKYDGADDRPLHPAEAADHGEEDAEGGPDVDPEA